MRSLFAAAAVLAVMTGCGVAPTTSSEPGSFLVVHSGQFDTTKQPLLIDCVFDGFMGAQSNAVSTSVRQVKRATGYRIDLIAGPFQYVVADVRDDGEYQLTRSSYASLVNLDKEEDASKACLEKYGKVVVNARPAERPQRNPFGTSPK